MVAFNMLWKLCVVVAFGLFATVTSTDVAQEQPKKVSFLRRFIGKLEEPTTEPQDAPEATKTNTQEKTETDEPPKYSVEWHLLPKPENRAALRYVLPDDLAAMIPEDCTKPILPILEKRVRKFLSIIEKGQNSGRINPYYFYQYITNQKVR